MKTIEELEKAVLAYVDRHNLGAKKKSSCYPSELYYSYTTMDWTELEAKIVPTKNGSKVVFKVDGKVTSIYK